MNQTSTGKPVLLNFLPPVFRQGQFYAFKIANRQVISDQWLPALEPFYTYELSPANVPPIHPKPIPLTAEQIFQGPGLVGSGWRDVLCYSDNTDYWLNVTGVGKFHITHLESAISLIESDPEAGMQLITETMLGPALILSLALQGVWCMHASAVLYENSLIAFMGKSGQGKSTLVAFLNASDDSEWQLAVDDVLPVTLIAGMELFALAHFPQLKFQSHLQPVPNLPEITPIRVIYLLDESVDRDNSIHIQRLNPYQGMLSLIQNTIAARLFNPTLLGEHLDFCSNASQKLPIQRLTYPRNCDLLPSVAEAISKDL